MRVSMLAAVFTIVATAASAATPATIKAAKPGGHVYVWITGKADEANTMIDQGVGRTHPELIFELIACVVDDGTKIIVTDLGFFTSTIMVTDGPAAGCRGDVYSDQFHPGN